MATKSPSKVRILDNDSIRSIINRLAYEVWEANYGEKDILVIGIDKRGGALGELIAEKLTKISKMKVGFSIAKKGKEGLSLEEDVLENSVAGKAVVIVDDVLYSGKTVFDALALVVPAQPKSVQAAVLIDRGHRNLPVYPNFVGTDLATTLLQHVAVEFSKDKSKIEAFLK